MITESENGTTVFDVLADDAPKKNWRQWLIGRPLQTADAPKQTIGKAIGLAVFASDALSSTAYATQEIMIILAVAASGALQYVFPISLAIVFLMAIVTISYEQTIHAYPSGGGAYIVARDNLGFICNSDLFLSDHHGCYGDCWIRSIFHRIARYGC